MTEEIEWKMIWVCKECENWCFSTMLYPTVTPRLCLLTGGEGEQAPWEKASVEDVNEWVSTQLNLKAAMEKQ